MAIFWPILIYHTLQRALCYEDTLSNALPALLKGKEQKSSQIWQKKRYNCSQNLSDLLSLLNMYIIYSIIFFYIVISHWECLCPQNFRYSSSSNQDNTINILYEQSLKITLSSIKRMNLAHGLQNHLFCDL